MRTTTDYKQLLADPQVSAVAIATPVWTHFSFAREALEAGKHVLVEKPLTANVAEAEELIEIAERHQLVLMVDHTFIYTGAVRKIREVLGPTDPAKAPPGSIRKEFGQTIMINAAHASDSAENAKREMAIVEVGENNFKPLIESFYARS